MHLYADDTQIYFSFDIHSKDPDLSDIRNCFQEIKMWMSQNFLKLNEDKTEVIEIGFYENRFSDLLLGNSSIKISEKAKNLGFYIDDTMSLKAQIAAVIQKCNMSLRNLHRIGSKLTKELKIQLVYSCVLSHLDYCNSVLGCISEAQLKTLQKIQNNAVRFIFGLKGKDYHKPITP